MEELTLKEQLAIARMPNKELAVKLLLGYTQEHRLEEEAWKKICAWKDPFYVALFFDSYINQDYKNYVYVSSDVKLLIASLPAEYSYSLVCKILRRKKHNYRLITKFNQFSLDEAVELWLLYFEKCVVDESCTVAEDEVAHLLELGLEVATLILLAISIRYPWQRREQPLKMTYEAAQIIKKLPEGTASLLFEAMDIDAWYQRHTRETWYELPIEYTFKLWLSYFEENIIAHTIHGWELETLLKMGVDNATLIIIRLFEALPRYRWSFDRTALEMIKTLPEENAAMLLEAINRDDDN